MSSRQVVIPRFQIIRKGKVLKVVPVNRKLLVVGSEEGAHLRLKHPKLAPRHVEIRVVEGRYLEAMNVAGEGRVALNGETIDRARLRDGDELDLGPVILKLTYKRTGMTVADQAIHEAAVPPGDDTMAGSPPPRAPVAEETEAEDEATQVGSRDELDELRQRAAELAKEDSVYADAPTAEIAAYKPPAPPPTPEPESESEPEEVLPAIPEPTESASIESNPEPTQPGLPPEGTAPNLDEIELDEIPVIVIEPPGSPSQRVSLRVGSFIVGSGRCAFRLSYPGVAPAHAEIMVMPDGALYLKHLGGQDLDTLLNGAPIQFTRWTSGARVQIGPVGLSIEPTQIEETPALAPVPPGADESLSDEAAPESEFEAASDTEKAPERVPTPEPEAPSEPEMAAEKASATAPGPEPAQTPNSAASSLLSSSEMQSAKLPAAPSDEPKAKKKATGKKKAKAKAPEADAFAAYREDSVEYSRPLAQRLMVPIAVLGALGLGIFLAWPQISSQVPMEFGGTKDQPTERELNVKRAAGPSGLDDKSAGSRRVNEGPMAIGQRQPKGEGPQWGDPGIDWENRERMQFGSGKAYETDHAQDKNYGRAGDAMEAEKPPGASPPAQAVAPGGSATISAASQSPKPTNSAPVTIQPGSGPTTIGGGGPTTIRPGGGPTSIGGGAVATSPAPPASSGGTTVIAGGGAAAAPPTPAGPPADLSEVKSVIQTNQRMLRQCYTSARQDDPSLAGTMWLEMSLGSDGRLRNVRVQSRSTLKSEAVRSCLERRLFSLQVPAPPGGPHSLTIPLDFAVSD